MSNDFFNDYEDRLLSDGSMNEREEETKSETVNNGEAEEYYELPFGSQIAQPYLVGDLFCCGCAFSRALPVLLR